MLFARSVPFSNSAILHAEMSSLKPIWLNYKMRYHVFIRSFREVFAPIRGKNGFSLPRQHAIVHYPALIRLFGAPNGVCTSITESKHIRAVKEPWHCSNQNAALFQMLTTNQRLDQLSAARDDFTERGMLNGTLLESILLSSTYCHHVVYQVLLTCLPLDLLKEEDRDKNESTDAEPQAAVSIPDEDIQAAIIDDDTLAHVKLAQRSCKSTSTQ